MESVLSILFVKMISFFPQDRNVEGLIGWQSLVYAAVRWTCSMLSVLMWVREKHGIRHVSSAFLPISVWPWDKWRLQSVPTNELLVQFFRLTGFLNLTVWATCQTWWWPSVTAAECVRQLKSNCCLQEATGTFIVMKKLMISAVQICTFVCLYFTFATWKKYVKTFEWNLFSVRIQILCLYQFPNTDP